MLNYINTEEVDCLSSRKSKKSIPLVLIASDDFNAWKKKLSKSEQSWVDAHQFNGASGQVIIFSNEKGAISKVAAASDKNNNDPWVFSKIAETVPDGSYHIESPLGKHELKLAAFGWAMAHYKYDHYLKDKKTKNAVLHVADKGDLKLIGSLVRGSNLTRDLVNTPTCDMGPDELTAVAKKLGRKFKAKIKITKGAALLKKGLNTIHTVGRAAEKEPQLIDMIWGNEKSPKVTLVGKGVCFDTGGLDIKPSSSMLTMKKDMGGAAHVLGLGQMIMESGLDIRLRILIPAVENNIAGNAFRPGDIIKSYKGTTIEVGNTDAEGRLVLCDALALASEEKPDLMMDFATLTGAARVALGTDIPPYFTDDKNLSDDLLKHSELEHDPLWPMPLYAPYKKLLASNIADINNVGSTGFGGAITAALFLKDFVEPDIAWVHFDLYAWNSGSRSGRPKGGEAMGLRAVFDYLSVKFKG